MCANYRLAHFVLNMTLCSDGSEIRWIIFAQYNTLISIERSSI